MNRGLFVLLGIAASLTFAGWRVHATRARATPYFVLVEDPSLSRPRTCDSLLGLADRVLEMKRATSNSAMTVLVLGDAATANEPWELGRYPIPTADRAMGTSATLLRRRRAVLDAILPRCEAIHRTTVSPIHLGIAEALATLRSDGCGRNSGCELLVDSDLEENAETAIRHSLDGQAARKFPLLDNSGIRVTLCGFAVTHGNIQDNSGRTVNGSGKRSAEYEDRLQERWRSLLSDPAGVIFEPYCPTYPSAAVTRVKK